MIPPIAQHYTRLPLQKMGRWALLPADTETWMTEETSEAFKALFGLPKGILNICTLDDGFMQNYVPLPYMEALWARVHEVTKRDMKGLETILHTFYALREQACRAIAVPLELEKKSHEELLALYQNNRSWVHRVSAYDQFGWITERYWEPLLEEILVGKLGLEKGSEDYHHALFTLTKPPERSTTLNERLALLKAARRVQTDPSSIQSAAAELAEQFGWMPVFTYGTPWDAAWYKKQLEGFARKDSTTLDQDIKALEDYSTKRTNDIQRIQHEYALPDRDMQPFVNFSLTLDARNEAEFFVSFAGCHLLPIYAEIAKRLRMTVRETRLLFEAEIAQALRGEIDPHAAVQSKQGIVAWGFDEEMKERHNLAGQEARELFEIVEKNVIESASPRTKKGVCASPGKAKGRARIILSPEQNDEVEAGDILITVATTVDYLPAMQRASAIVTDVGGLTCHAAVISREFGIPCIVSHPNATTAFKSGQWIELDADKATITSVTL